MLFRQKMMDFINILLRHTAARRPGRSLAVRGASALAALNLVLLLGVAAVAAPGDLDTTLGGGGVLSYPIGAGNDTLRAITIQMDGKIVAAGYARIGSTDDFAVARFNPDGSPDESFGGGDGIVTTPMLGSDDQAFAVALQPDGKIVVGGEAFNGSNMDFALARYNSDGSLDTTFDGDGKLVVPIGTGFDFIHSIAIQPDGRIVAAGRTSTSSGIYDIALARFNPSGSFDTTFDTDGKLTTPLTTNDDRAHALVLQPDGKIVVGGYIASAIPNGSTSDFALVRYNSNGSLDTTFDGDGKVTTPFDGIGAEVEALALQPDGKLVAAGFYWNGSNYDFAAARYNPNGSLDTTFDGDGKYTKEFNNSADFAYAVAVQPDGKIVLAGNSAAGQTTDFAVVRLNPDGSPDNTFGTGGTALTDVLGSVDSAYAVAVQPDGKILAAGISSFSVNYDFALVRYLGDELPNRTANFDTDRRTDVSIWNSTNHNWYFINSTDDSLHTYVDWGSGALGDRAVPGDYDGDGRTDLAVFRPSEANWYIVKSSDGSALVRNWGAANDIPVPGDYDLDGKTDIAIFRPSEGRWYIIGSRANTVIQKSWGTNNDVPVPADYDGDGATDVAVFRPSDGNWYIITSRDRFTRIVNWGTTGDKLVPGDYDGDGRVDIAVFRASEANWYIRLWTGAVVLQNWGETTDVPVPGDYDGDARTDIAVWRASEFNWFIQESATGAGRAVKLEQPGMPVAAAHLPQ